MNNLQLAQLETKFQLLMGSYAPWMSRAKLSTAVVKENMAMLSSLNIG